MNDPGFYGLPSTGTLEPVHCECPRFVNLSKVSFVALVSLLSSHLDKPLYRNAFCELLDFSPAGLEDIDSDFFPNSNMKLYEIQE